MSTKLQPVPKTYVAELPVERLAKEMLSQAETLSRGQARYLVDLYYMIQDFRIQAGGQQRSSAKEGEQSVFIPWIHDQFHRLEKEITKVLDAYSSSHDAGRWAKDQVGIGPVIAAGLLAHIDPEEATTAGAVWRFGGMDESSIWLGQQKATDLVQEIMGKAKVVTGAHIAACALRVNKRPESISQSVVHMREHRQRLKKTDDGPPEEGVEDSEPAIFVVGDIDPLEKKPVTRKELVAVLARRPYNAKLKVLAVFKAGESFVKTCNLPKSFYGKLYRQRKDMEIAKNDAGMFADQAAAKLEKFNIGKDTEAYKHYAAGKLPPAHIHARARRYAVKLFIAHFQHVLYKSHFKTDPPMPYVIGVKGHKDYIPPPNYP